MNSTYTLTLTLTGKQLDALRELVFANEDQVAASTTASDSQRQLAHELTDAMWLTRASVIKIK